MNTPVRRPATRTLVESIANGREPRQRRLERALGRVAERHLVERHAREQQQRADLREDQDVLEARRQVGAEHADQRHAGDDHERQDRHRGLRVRGAVGPDQDVEVARGDVGERADDQDAGGADRPAAHPAGPRPERAGHPGERRAAVLVGLVHVVEGRGDEEHRHEGREQDRRRLDAGQHDHDADDGGERVGRGRRGQPDHQRVDEADRVLLEARLLLGKDGVGGGWLGHVARQLTGRSRPFCNIPDLSRAHSRGLTP